MQDSSTRRSEGELIGLLRRIAPARLRVAAARVRSFLRLAMAELMTRGRIPLNRLRGHGYSVLGIITPIQTSVLSPVMERVVAEGSNQRPEITAALAIIRPSDTVLELGAGLGVVSTAVRKYAKASRVVVVEANPDLLPTIARTHELNSVAGIEVRNGVVMAAPAGRFVPFYKHRDVWRSSLSEEPDQPMERIEVPAFGLADVLQEVRPNVLLLDIEGGEMELFDRAASLETLRSVSVEVHPQLYGSDGVTRLTESLSRLGFVRDTQRSAGTQLIFHRTS